jgi:HlyD family secretion protein
MKKFVIPAILVVAVLLVVWWASSRGEGEASHRFVEVTRGDVRSVVTSTGILQAIATIEVGTQVSGKESEIYVDFNDRVTKGQRIARIDPVLLEQAVRASVDGVVLDRTCRRPPGRGRVDPRVRCPQRSVP